LVTDPLPDSVRVADAIRVALIAGVSAQRLRQVADRLADGWPDQAILAGGNDVLPLIEACRATSVESAVAYLRGAADGYALGSGQINVEVVWSGPSSPASPVRATAHVLADLIALARRELILVTYSARAYAPITHALNAAIDRGVDVTVVVETLQGAGSALSGAEPAAAFATVPDVHLWHWPTDQRPKSSAKTHAKIAVADRRLLFTSSVNLTESRYGAQHGSRRPHHRRRRRRSSGGPHPGAAAVRRTTTTRPVTGAGRCG
jgi:phosphatidylserine/phosphatidylglycerophosphate/cardiolipin synthase-like enzyme